MAIVYSYPTVTPELQDLLIGVEMAIQGGEDAPRTRTFTIQSIVDLVEVEAGVIPNLQQVTTAGPTTTVGITATTNANLAVPIKGIVDWEGTGDANNIAILGQIRGNGSIPGIGVKGTSPSGIGVYGESSENSGVRGLSNSGTGVKGEGEAGVWGVGNTYGIHGQSTALGGIGVYGESTYGAAVYGNSASGYGGYFSSGNVEAIYCDGLMLATSNITTAGNFIKSGGTPTQSLMANGTTRNIPIFNNSIPTQVIPAATVTYLTGSNISTANIKAGSVVNWDIAVLKTAAGVVAPIFTVTFGTTGTIADSTLLTFTGSAQTAVADGGLFSIKCIFKTVGSGTTAVLAGYYTLMHNAQIVGLSTLPVNFSFQTSPGFNSTLANAVLGVTVNSGAAAAWTVNQVSVKLENQV